MTADLAPTGREMARIAAEAVGCSCFDGRNPWCPCSYHEGWADGWDTAQERTKAVQRHKGKEGDQ